MRRSETTRYSPSIRPIIAVSLLVALGLAAQAAMAHGPCACPWSATPIKGGGGGSAFSDDLTEATRITSITIRHGNFVDSIQTTWLSTSGQQVTGVRHGGGGGNPSVINLKPNEAIVRVEGRSGQFVDQLTFHTNLGNKFGPYGGDGGSPFTLSGLCAGGFVGRSGKFLDAFGVLSTAP